MGMGTQKTYEDIKKLLKEHRQGHLLAFWDQLNTAQRQNLLAQIQKLDLAKIDDWVANYVKNSASVAISSDLVPASFYSSEPADPQQRRKYSGAIELGRELIQQGKVAAFVVAGGQGTRLGFDGPKGNFPISPVENKTLFQIFAESIAAASQKY
ncbi:unnamed protein product, partial [marine sediment metagenome]